MNHKKHTFDLFGKKEKRPSTKRKSVVSNVYIVFPRFSWCWEYRVLSQEISRVVQTSEVILYLWQLFLRNIIYTCRNSCLFHSSDSEVVCYRSVWKRPRLLRSAFVLFRLFFPFFFKNINIVDGKLDLLTDLYGSYIYANLTVQ